jgi:hypothetical protein
MVVVDGAHGRSGERLAVTITGALQTSTGRMVFAKLDGGTTPGGPSRFKTTPKRSGNGRNDPGAANPR